jgi:integrase
MPKITNKRYKTFFDPTLEFKEYSMEEFKNNLDQINYENPFKTQEARALSIALYYTGFRGIEVLNIRTHHIEKKMQDIIIYAKGAKHGIEGNIVLPSDSLTRELYNYAKKLPPEMLLFTDFISKSKNKPKYKRFNKITNRIETIIGDYTNPGNNLYYFCMKWFEVPAYYFRHSRFTSMIKNGASIEEVRLAKLGKTDSSTRMYVKYDIHDARKRKKHYPKFD